MPSVPKYVLLIESSLSIEYRARAAGHLAPFL
jgi:hypothetical protein